MNGTVRLRAWALATGWGSFGAAVVTCVVLMVAGTTGPAVTAPHWVLGSIAAVAVASLCLSLAAGTQTFLLVTAASLGLTISAPWVGAVLHAIPADELFPATMGLTVAAVILAAPRDRPVRWRTAVLSCLAVVVWMSLIFGALTLLGLDVAALYDRGQRALLGIGQLRGIVGHPNGMALIAGLALLLQVQSFRARWSRWNIATRRRLVVLGPAASGVALIWTMSRTGLIAVAVVATLLLAQHWLPRTRRWTTLLVCVAAVAAILPTILGAGGTSFHGRSFAWQVALDELAGRWVLGPGPWVFSPEFWADYSSRSAAPWEPLHGHNQVLQSLVLLGLIGVVVLVVAAFCLAVIAVTAGEADDLWAFVTLALFLVHAGLETVFGVGDVAATYLPLLVAAGVWGSSWALSLAARRRTVG